MNYPNLKNNSLLIDIYSKLKYYIIFNCKAILVKKLQKYFYGLIKLMFFSAMLIPSEHDGTCKKLLIL